MADKTDAELEAEIAAAVQQLEDHRAKDQQAAMEAALLAGTLPDHDRRAAEPAADVGASLYKDISRPSPFSG